MEKLNKPAFDPNDVAPRTGSIYPQALANAVNGRSKRALTAALGLSQFGVNIVDLAPGASSALRHYHSHEDEFIYLLQGEVVRLSEGQEQPLGAGMCAGFPAGVADGHRITNRSLETARYLEVGTRDPRDAACYPDDDLHVEPERYEKPVFTRKDGTPYESK
ncbi:MAG: cupin domain-containing protein [Deltaproteobacteria bacterium]|nr:cupin domain-containing protein [Deltaproteobacteria bacterium]